MSLAVENFNIYHYDDRFWLCCNVTLFIFIISKVRIKNYKLRRNSYEATSLVRENGLHPFTCSKSSSMLCTGWKQHLVEKKAWRHVAVWFHTCSPLWKFGEFFRSVLHVWKEPSFQKPSLFSKGQRDGIRNLITIQSKANSSVWFHEKKNHTRLHHFTSANVPIAFYVSASLHHL